MLESFCYEGFGTLFFNTDMDVLTCDPPEAHRSGGLLPATAADLINPPLIEAGASPTAVKTEKRGEERYIISRRKTQDAAVSARCPFSRSFAA